MLFKQNQEQAAAGAAGAAGSEPELEPSLVASLGTTFAG